MNQWTAQASQVVSASVVYTKISSNELLGVYGNYSAEPANQTRFPCKKSAKVGATVTLPPF